MRGARALLILAAALLALAAADAGRAAPASARAASCPAGYVAARLSCSGSTSEARPTPVAAAAVTLTLGRTVLLGRRSRVRGCVRGPLPDRRCSPGAHSPRLTRAVLCSDGFRTGSVRNVPESVKFAVEREYGMRPRPYGRTIEIDHIVSLELGGSNSIANLYPEPGAGTANYRVKDRLENRLHEMVCAGQIRLRAAQRQIAANWKTLYRRVFGVGPS